MGITRRSAPTAAASSILTVTAACGAPDDNPGAGGDSVDIGLLLTGTDAPAAGVDQGLWLDALPKFEEAS
jgi:hypothetical protein